MFFHDISYVMCSMLQREKGGQDEEEKVFTIQVTDRMDITC